MKQIIPFKKELLFKTKVSEITSISLEHTLSLKEDDLISGEFYINGDYKMTEGSINREKFQFKLPFDIALDSRYNIDSIIIDIDNFYYEIINNESLLVNIDVYVEGEKQEEITETAEEEPIELESLSEDRTEKVLTSNKQDIKETRNNDIEDLFKETYEPAVTLNKPQPIVMEFEKEDVNNIEVKTNEFNLFENVDNSDTYITYYVYIVKEDDNLDKILSKYNVSREEVGHYNDLDNIKTGTKLIIPSCNNE